jgi:hypothetical protein
MRIGFPSVVDEVTVRLVAAVVVVIGTVGLITGWWQVYAALAADFILRVAFGPRMSPLAQLVLKTVRPRIGAAPRPTPGPPKRFAATTGAVLTSAAAVLGLVAGTTGSAAATTTVFALGAIMVVFPALEAAAGICVGCLLFAQLMKLGLVPAEVCQECADISRRVSPAVEASTPSPA